MPRETVAGGGPQIDVLAGELHQWIVAQHLDPVRDRATVVAQLRRIMPLLSATDEVQVLAKVADRVAGLGPLAALLDDDATTDVLVNGPGTVWVERSGRLAPTDVTLDETEIRRIIERLTAPSGRRVDLRSPVVDLRLLDGSRAHVVLPPVAVDGPYLTIRRFRTAAVPLAHFAEPDVVDLLEGAVRRRANIVVSGGTGSGKTTLLNALCAALDPDERTVTIEDAAELRLPGEQVIRLEARPATSDGIDAVTIEDLVRASLRMRPDRVIVGEVRGPEALDMLWAMNTGHDGSMTTCHANSTVDALRRIEAMALGANRGLDPSGVRRRITSAVDLVVQVARAAGGSRRLVSVAEPTVAHAHDPELSVTEISDGESVHRAPTRPARWLR